MKMSRRARRMARHHRKQKHVTALNLVSLMDIFTILVFFLLVSSSPAPNLPSSRSIHLPEASTSELPTVTPVVMITPEAILVQGRQVMTRPVALPEDDREGLKPLNDALSGLRGQDGQPGPNEDRITIMGDAKVPYELLKRVFASCSQAKFTKISLVVSSNPRRS
ncbi:MAG: biopolymer transporter ExbD [Gammaproteobacteria bacterium]|nr:biopolymer transporter ExbD [Gammaproteobacteria bacterium]